MVLQELAKIQWLATQEVFCRPQVAFHKLIDLCVDVHDVFLKRMNQGIRLASGNDPRLVGAHYELDHNPDDFYNISEQAKRKDSVFLEVSGFLGRHIEGLINLGLRLQDTSGFLTSRNITLFSKELCQFDLSLNMCLHKSAEDSNRSHVYASPEGGILGCNLRRQALDKPHQAHDTENPKDAEDLIQT
jgi:hypothetical protein